MGKSPAFQFYPGDWFREPGLRTACIVVRGCWAETLFTMHDAIPRGLLKYSVLGYARLWRIHPQVACYVIWQLDCLGVADVEYQDEETSKEIEKIAIDCDYVGIVNEEAKEPGSYMAIPEGAIEYCTNQRHYSALFVQLKSRRMYSEWLSKETERLRGKERRKKASIQKTSKKSPRHSSSSSSSSNKHMAIDMAFCEFWKSYPRKVKKPDAEKAWRQVKPTPEDIGKIMEDMPRWKSTEKRFVPYPGPYLRNRRWEDEDKAVSDLARASQIGYPASVEANPLSRQSAADIIRKWKEE